MERGGFKECVSVFVFSGWFNLSCSGSVIEPSVLFAYAGPDLSSLQVPI